MSVSVEFEDCPRIPITLLLWLLFIELNVLRKIVKLDTWKRLRHLINKSLKSLNIN
ncbi:MAG: hypothetical protein ACI96W_002786 [Paraglaciecola sp.]|jgi:hypothetical protein